MSKNSESSFASRLASITGANISKVASLAEAHAITDAESLQKLASMPMGDMFENDAFVNGFQTRLAERMGELDAAVIKLMG